MSGRGGLKVLSLKTDVKNEYIRKAIKFIKDNLYRNRFRIVIESGIGTITIIPLCIAGQGCQGGIEVKTTSNRKVKAEMKRGTVIWFLGDVLKTGTITEYISWVNYIFNVWSLISSIIDEIPTEYYIKRRWDLEITLFTWNYDFPQILKNELKGKSSYALNLIIQRNRGGLL